MSQTLTARNEGTIFNIQRYSIHDGPGIRTAVFFKGCPLRCNWCQNPESWLGEIELLFDARKCSGCGRCVPACRTGAARVSNGVSSVDRGTCIKCGACSQVCPNEARRMVGWRTTVPEVMDKVMKDARFYANSGGGVTFTGGEPTFQPGFLYALLQASKEIGIHTAIETCGYTSPDIIDAIIEYTDLFLFDIKHVDPGQHAGGTGKSNELILNNARRIAQCREMRIRVPVIPGFNSSKEAIAAIAGFVRAELGNIPIDLLPYNRMAGAKYDMLGKPYHLAEPLSDGEMADLEAIVRQYITVTS